MSTECLALPRRHMQSGCETRITSRIRPRRKTSCPPCFPFVRGGPQFSPQDRHVPCDTKTPAPSRIYQITFRRFPTSHTLSRGLSRIVHNTFHTCGKSRGTHGRRKGRFPAPEARLRRKRPHPVWKAFHAGRCYCGNPNCFPPQTFRESETTPGGICEKVAPEPIKGRYGPLSGWFQGKPSSYAQALARGR